MPDGITTQLGHLKAHCDFLHLKNRNPPCLSQVSQPSVLEADHIANFNMLDKRVEEKPEERREGKKRCHSQSALRPVLGKCPNRAPG